MRLNLDCMRDIMLFLERTLEIEPYGFVPLRRSRIFEYFRDKYKYEEILYSMLQLHESNYIVTDFQTKIPNPRFIFDNIYYITPKGYEFIERMRDNKRWKSVKKGASAIRDYSLSALSAIADGITSAAISAYFSGQTNP